jgi:hypothetical protein
MKKNLPKIIFSTFLYFSLLLLLLFKFPSSVRAQAGIIDEEFIKNFSETAAEAAKKFGSNVAAYEIWNEQDHHSSASIYLYPEDYGKLLKAAYEAIKANSSSQVIVGGLASGDVSYLTKMGSISADGVGVHPYIINIPMLKAKISEYQGASQGKPLWITEFGWETPNESDQADYLVQAYNAFREKGVSVSIWYCWSDTMNPGFGLIKTNGEHKQAYDAFPSGAGVNLDPKHSDNPTPDQLQDLGAQWVRMVYKPLSEIDFEGLIQGYKNAGIETILILNQETLQPDTEPLPPTEEPIIISGPSHVCSDFIEERGDLHGGIAAEKTEISPLTGNISLLSVKFPDFSKAASSMAKALERTLDYDYVQNLSLPGSTTMFLKHYALPQNEEGGFDFGEMTECDQSPESEVSVPASLWGKLTGAARGLCTYMGFCAPVKKYQFALKDPAELCPRGSCAAGQEAKEETLSPKEGQKTSFSLNNAWGKKTTKTEVDPQTGIETTETKSLKKVMFLSRSKLAGGLETASNVDFLRNRLTPEVIETVMPQDEARALTEGFRYDVQFSPVEEGEHISQYYDLRKIRNYYCMYLCTLYPASYNISNVDPLCPSCDPNDDAYKDPPQPPIPEPGSLPPYCHWNPAYGCDYYTCAYERDDQKGKDECVGCGEGKTPFCEDTGADKIYCNSKGLYLPKDVGSCSRSACLTAGQNCTLKSEPISSKEYYRNHPEKLGWTEEQLEQLPDDGPPYGPCLYANPDVCVHDGWSEWEGCINICNHQCCGS